MQILNRQPTIVDYAASPEPVDASTPWWMWLTAGVANLVSVAAMVSVVASWQGHDSGVSLTFLGAAALMIVLEIVAAWGRSVVAAAIAGALWLLMSSCGLLSFALMQPSQMSHADAVFVTISFAVPASLAAGNLLFARRIERARRRLAEVVG
jgi:hypothetical protein